MLDNLMRKVKFETPAGHCRSKDSAWGGSSSNSGNHLVDPYLEPLKFRISYVTQRCLEASKKASFENFT
jgi:hypothetical protein